MTDAEFDVIARLLRHCWKGELSDEQADSYRLLLDGYSGAQLLAALHKLAAGGRPFLPTVPEILAALHQDVGVPTWEEVEAAVFDNGPAVEHPLAIAFQSRHRDGLRLAPVHDPDHGHLERRRWQQAWERFVETNRERSAHELALDAAAPRAQLGPRRMDPLASLGVRGQLERGE